MSEKPIINHIETNKGEEEKWKNLSHKDRLDLIVLKITNPETKKQWFPWELEFQNNYPDEIEKQLKIILKEQMRPKEKREVELPENKEPITEEVVVKDEKPEPENPEKGSVGLSQEVKDRAEEAFRRVENRVKEREEKEEREENKIGETTVKRFNSRDNYQYISGALYNIDKRLKKARLLELKEALDYKSKENPEEESVGLSQEVKDRAEEAFRRVENRVKEREEFERVKESHKPPRTEDLFESARKRLHSDIDERFEKISEDNKERDKKVDEKLGINIKQPKESPEAEKVVVKDEKPEQETQPEKPIESIYVKEIMAKMNLLDKDLKEHAPQFFDLNEGEQIYVLDKLRQKINLDASLIADEEVNDVLNKKVKFLSKDWLKKTKYKWTKEFQQETKRKEKIQEIKSSGLVGYEKDLGNLAKHVKEFPFRIDYKDGKLIIGYEDGNTFKNAPEYAKRFGKNFDPEKLTEEFNIAATALSEIPYEWTTPQATFSQKRKYEKALAEFKKHKAVLGGAKYEQLKRDIPEDKVDVAYKMWQDVLESSIKVNRVITSHPEISEWEEDPKLRPSFRKTTNFLANTSNWMKGSGAVAIGMGVRWLTRKSLEFGAGFVATAAIGGYLGWRKKALEYEEKERKNRYGADIEDKGIKKYVEALPAIERIKLLTQMLDNAEGDDKKSEAIARRLKNHLFVIGQRIEEGRINFGDKDKRLSNIIELENAINEANNKLFLLGFYNEDSEATKELLSRFNRFVKDNVAKKNQLEAKRISALKAAAVSLTGYTLGYAIKDAFSLVGSPQTVLERIKEMVYEGGDGKWDDVAPGKIRGIPKDQVFDNSYGEIDYKEDVASPADTTDAQTQAPAEETPKNETTKEEVQNEENQDGEKESKKEEDETSKKDQEKIFEQIKKNTREIKNADGSLNRIEIRSRTLFKEVLAFKDNPDNFLTEPGVGSLRPVKEEAKTFLALERTLDIYEPGSEQRIWIENEMNRLGGEIRSKVGNIFAPYENMVGLREANAEPFLDSVPKEEYFDADTGAQNQNEVAENIAQEIQGFSGNSETVNSLPSIKFEDVPFDEKLSKEASVNITEIRENGKIANLKIKNEALVDDVKKFRSNAGNFLVEDLSKTDLPENFQTRSFGIKSLMKVRDQSEEFLALNKYRAAYEPGSEQRIWIENEMNRLGGEIRSKVGNIFAPYENMVSSGALPENNLASNIEIEESPKIKPFSYKGDFTEFPNNNPNTPNINIPEESPKIKPFSMPQEYFENQSKIPEVNTDAVSASYESGKTTLNFDSDEVTGKMYFEENSNGVLESKEDADFSTEKGRAFRKNFKKYISPEDIERVVSGSKKYGLGINAKDVLNRYEDFIDKREALRVSGLPLDSDQALALKREMTEINDLFKKHTGIGLLERIGAVESGKGIDALVLETETEGLSPKKNSLLIKTVEEILGEKANIEGNIVRFGDDKIGFYGESSDEQSAIEMGRNIARSKGFVFSQGLNPVEKLTKTKDGMFRYLVVFEDVNDQVVI